MLSLIFQARLVAFAAAFNAALLLGNYARAHEFTWDNLAFAEIKLSGHFDYDNHVDWYMQKYRPSVWKSCKNDEFTLEDRRQETLTMFRDRVKRFDETQTFYLRARISVGDYDFKEGGFPVKGMGPTNYWYERTYSNGDMPSQMRIFMKNTEDFKQLPMPKDQARAFVSSRKNRSGSVDRTVYAMFELKIVGRRGRGQLEAEVQTATFYSDNSHTRFLGQLKKQANSKSPQLVSTDQSSDETAPPVPSLDTVPSL